MEVQETLKEIFGHTSLRPAQEPIVRAVLAGQDTLAILPTGAGKSLCYQLPAVMRPGLTLVVSPLIALMKDQVDQLRVMGVSATFVNSSLPQSEIDARLLALDAGLYKLLYVAPERLMLPDFLARMATWDLDCLAVDEAHCISEWGHDFRAEYRQLAQVRKKFPQLPVVALTATATPRVRADILAQLGFSPEAQIFTASFDRPNLHYRVVEKTDATAQVVAYVTEHPQDSGIVYCQSRKSVEAMATALQQAGFKAEPYHAGLDSKTRARHQDAFLRDEVQIMVATIAFGMGINKPNVRHVIHADLPKNIEGYYQETGRAGRDDLPADCLLLFSRGDVFKHLFLMEKNSDPSIRETARLQLDQMVTLAQSPHCRRKGILGYFGESWTAENCGACDNCSAPRQRYDGTEDAQKLLSCVLRIRQKSGIGFGMGHVVAVLTGSRNQMVLRWGHETLSTWGIGQTHKRAHWQDVGRQLLDQGFLQIERGEFETVAVTESGLQALKDRAKVTLHGEQAAPRTTPEKPQNPGQIPCDEGLFQALRQARQTLARQRDVPPYVIFSDAALRLMARVYPQTDAEFLTIPGVGRQKLRDFGPIFLQEVRDWLLDHPQMPFENVQGQTPRQRPGRPNGPSPTARLTLDLWQKGMTIAEIAAERQLVAMTIEGHLAQCVETGEELDPRAFYTEEEEQQMQAAFAQVQGTLLRPVFDFLGEQISYGKLRLFQAFSQQNR